MPRASKKWLNEAQIKVLTGRRTQEVWRVFSDDEWRVAADVQAKLGFASKAVYYQLKKLAAVGLLIVDESGRAARYRRFASSAGMPDGYQGAEYERLAAKLVGTSLRHSIRQFERTAALAPEQPRLVDRLSIHETRFRIADDRLEEFRTWMRETMRQMESFSSPDGDEVRLVLVMAPETS